MSIVIENNKAYHLYNITQEYECGIVLFGNEVKSIASGQCSIDQAFCNANENNELYIINMYVAPFKNANNFNKINATKKRKLLLHKNQIIRINHITKKEHLTIIPLKLYSTNGKYKLLIGLAKSKTTKDKRMSLKNKQIDREINNY